MVTTVDLTQTRNEIVDGAISGGTNASHTIMQLNLAPPQRVWMAVYPPEHERRLRLHLPAFKTATEEHHHPWALIDVTTSFEKWMAEHEYREAYFEEPHLVETALAAFFDHLVAAVRSQLAEHDSPDGVVGLLGAGSLFGLGDTVRVTAFSMRSMTLSRVACWSSSGASTMATTTGCSPRSRPG